MAVSVADLRFAAPGYAGGGLVAVPHSAQNFAVGLRLALQLVQCFEVAVPHSGQNLAPTCTGLWQLLHATVATAAAASAGAGGGGAYGACAGACIACPAAPSPMPRNIGATAPPPCAMPWPAPCSISACAAWR